MLNVEIKDGAGNVVGVFMAEPQTFKTGSTGFRAFGKMSINNEKYQMNLNIVLIGSKNKEVDLNEEKK